MSLLLAFERYKALCLAQGLEIDLDAAQEVADRIWQLCYALEQMEIHVDDYHKKVREETLDHRRVIATQNILFNNARFYVESYYYFANRIRHILQFKSEPLPYLKGFKCPGVRDARNHLIEHPEGKGSRATFVSYSYNEGTGLRLRTGNCEQQKVRDKGILANAKEFECNFMDIIDHACNEITKDRPVPN